MKKAMKSEVKNTRLCSFGIDNVPGKYEYGVALRENLRRIEKENWDS